MITALNCCTSYDIADYFYFYTVRCVKVESLARLVISLTGNCKALASDALFNVVNIVDHDAKHIFRSDADE